MSITLSKLVLVLLCVAITNTGLWPMRWSPVGDQHPENSAGRSLSPSGTARQTPNGLQPAAALRNVSLPTTAVKTRQASALGRLPVAFEANQGQWPASVNFGVRRGGSMGFIETGGTLMISAPSSAPVQSTPGLLAKNATYRFEMKIAGASTGAKAVGDDRLPGVANYIIGNDRANWRGGIPSFRRAIYRGIYSGIDLTYYGNDKGIEYDFTVAPGYSPSIIKLSLSGGGPVRLTDSGDLQFENDGGDIALPKPVCYQKSGNNRQHVDGHYVLAQDGQVGFQVGGYDMTRALVIDPVVDYSTYLGGEQSAQGNGIAVDSDGNAYVVGAAEGGFPVTVGSPQPPNGGDFIPSLNDVFVTKLNPEGTALVYSTIIRGSQEDSGESIAVDKSGEAFITGLTFSSDFPVTAGAFQKRLGTPFVGSNAFVAKLSADGSSLIYSTYLGGNGSDAGNSVAIDAQGNAYVAGLATSTNFPVTAGVLQAVKGDGASQELPSEQPGDGFVTKVNPSGGALIYSSYIGGAGIDFCNAIAVDKNGEAFVTGSTTSANFPVTPNAFQTNFGGGTDEFGNPASDCFVAKVNATATELVYSTFLGGDQPDLGAGIAVDAQGKAYITGSTASSQFPTTPGAITAGGSGVFTTSTKESSSDSWSAINTGMQDAAASDFVFDTSTSPSTVYAATFNGAFKSADQGGHWTAINGNLPVPDLLSIAFAPGNPAMIFVGSQGAGGFRSLDGGVTWQPLNFAQEQAKLSALAINPADPSVVLANDSLSGVYRSSDGGSTWTQVLRSEGTLLATDPNNPAIFYAGGNGLSKSTDAGVTWQVSSGSRFGCSAMAVDPATSDVYAVTNLGLLKSTDGTVTWTNLNDGLPPPGALCVAPGADGVYVGIGGGIYRGANGGKTWAADSNGVLGVEVTAIATDPRDPTRVYAGGFAGGGFVTVLNPAGSALVYSTCLSGAFGHGVAVDADGNAYIGGEAVSANFPTTANTYPGKPQPPFEGGGFVTKLSPSGSLLYSTYLAGSGPDAVLAVAVDKSQAYVTGQTNSDNFPVTQGCYQRTLNSFEGNAFVTRMETSPRLKAKLSISQTGPATIKSGQGFEYQITVTNNGPDPAFDVVVTYVFPLVLGTLTTTFGSGEEQLTFTIPEVAPGTPVTTDLFGGAFTNCTQSGTFSVTNVATIVFSSPTAPKAKSTASLTSKLQCP
jgi:uncharacterized repeat protein (TIGR01451 family)